MAITVTINKTAGSISAAAYVTFTVSSDSVLTSVDATVDIDGGGADPCCDIAGPISPYLGSVTGDDYTKVYRIGKAGGWDGDVLVLSVEAESGGGGGETLLYDSGVLPTQRHVHGTTSVLPPWELANVIDSAWTGTLRMRVNADVKWVTAPASNVMGAYQGDPGQTNPFSDDSGSGGATLTTFIGSSTYVNKDFDDNGALTYYDDFTAPGATKSIYLYPPVTFASGFTPTDAWFQNLHVTLHSVGSSETDDDEATWVIAGGRTTADHIRNDATLDAFYYLKITGIDKYFGSRIDPTNVSRYGSAAWTLPDGMTWVPGMETPDSSFDQSLKDIIGGIASAERCRLQLTDFAIANGQSFFGRMLSPGRTAASATATIGTLAGNFAASATTGSLLVQGSGGAFVADADLYIGGETMHVSAVSGPSPEMLYSLSIDERNKYPCHENYPPRTGYRIVLSEDGSVDHTKSILVSQNDPISFVNRTAALYIGHLKPDGTPEPEANSLCRIIGSIRSIGYGRSDGPVKYEFEIESVMADLEKSLVAPYLATATIADGVNLPTSSWRKLVVIINVIDESTGLASSALKEYALTETFYSSLNTVVGALNDTFRDTGPLELYSGGYKFYMSAVMEPVDDDKYAVKLVARSDTTSSTLQWQMEVSYGWVTGETSVGLLSALGWTSADSRMSTAEKPTGTRAELNVVAPRPKCKAFIPTRRTGTAMEIPLVNGTNGIGSDVGARFFTDQGDGTGVAYVRTSDGQVLPITAVAAGAITLANRVTAGVNGELLPFVYIEEGQEATVEQVIHVPSGVASSGEMALFQLIGSKGYGTDGLYNIFPEGVGFGLVDLMNQDSFSENAVSLQSEYPLDIDRTMKFGELWTGVAKLNGLFLTWDVATCGVALRCLRTAAPALASSTGLVLSDSNRKDPDDRTKVDIDIGNLRTGWVVKSGYDYKEKKFTAGDLTINDNYAISAYRIASRTETIEDRLVPAYAANDARERYATLIAERLAFTRYPQAKVQRGVNKTGLLESPGTYLKIIDNTIVNPFTGRPGITDADDVYCFITGVRMNYEKGEVQVTAVVDQINDASVLRPWSPCGLVDYSQDVNGYDTATGVISLSSHYTARGAGYYDGIDFLVGDKVTIISRANDGALSYEEETEVTAVAADGRTITVETGLPAFPDYLTEAIVILQDWADQTTARRSTSATRVSFQGDGVALSIDGTDRLHKWT